jgi:NAD(P)-dependent dehydrogenase (short-subunit alcohol dehydrogenase family)
MIRHAIITGGSRGIGLAIARRLLADGIAVSLVARDPRQLAAAAAQLSGAGLASSNPAGAADGVGEVLTAALDVCDAAAVEQGFKRLIEARGGLSILVNNAGAAESAPLQRIDAALWQRMLDINLTGTFHCIQAAAPALLASSGARLVNVASTAGQTGYAYVAAYCAAKHGVVGLTRALAREWATRSITVNAVCPGFTDTDLTRASIERIVRTTGRSAEAVMQSLTGNNPQRRLIRPEEVAAAVAWLCAPESASVTGQCISVAGGEVA